MAKLDTRLERNRFWLGFGGFFVVFLLSYVWILYIMPLPSSSAGLYALISFTVGVLVSIILIFTRHSLMGLGGSLATILFVVLFAFSWPWLH
jgi:hypothetical protein